MIEDVGSVNSAATESCPYRPRVTAPPPPLLPPPPPMALTEDNRHALENYLLEYYASSTFNNCTHQQLPGMAGAPLRVHIDSLMPATARNLNLTVV